MEETAVVAQESSSGSAVRRSPASLHNRVRDVAAAAAGNALEWFDFTVYGYFAGTIAKVFFPAAGSLGSMLLATATFGVGFVVRPLGSVVLGLYADRVGRKAALTLSIWLMTFGTAAIAFAPPFAVAGWLGAVILVLARLVQGFAASGEYGSAVAFLAEKAPAHRRNFVVSLQMSSTMLIIVVAGVVGTVLTTTLNAQQMESWGWRVPFLLGLLIGPVGYYIRRNVEESETFVAKAGLTVRQVLARLFGQHLLDLAAAIGITVISTVAFYVNLVYMPTFAVKQLGLPALAPFISTAVAGVVVASMAPLTGYLADTRVKPVWLFLGAALAHAALVLPLYRWLLVSPSLHNLIVMQVLLAIPMGAMFGLVPAISAGIFPTEIRATALSIAYNFPTTVFGGFSPLIVTYLIATTHNGAAPAYYIMAATFISLICMTSFAKKRNAVG